jgi:hypothetical protein
MFKVFKHPIYWIRYGISFLFLWPGFWIYDFGARLCSVGNKLQDLAVRIEGEIPEDDDYQAPTPPVVRESGQALSPALVVPELSGDALRENAKDLADSVRLILWNDEIAPGIEKLDSGSISFYDYESLWHFKVGDQIHYATKAGTTVYVISHIEPANKPDFDKTLRKVIARRKA